MFERFTERARRMVVYAQEESRRLRHDHIGTEHVLLGLIRDEEGVAAKVLGALGVALDHLRDEIEQTVGTGSAIAQGHIPFTPAAKRTLELSLREALQLGHNHIGTGHVLLGLIHEGEGVAARVLQPRGVTLDRVRQQVIQLRSGSRAVESLPPDTHASAGVKVPPSLEKRLARVEQALRPLPEVLADIADTLDAVVARLDALEGQLGDGGAKGRPAGS